MNSSKLESYFTKYDQLDYVIAYGSIGRGETPYVKDKDGNDRLYNDLDLILVTEQRTTVVSLLPKIIDEIKELFGVKWVDLLVWDKKQLSKKRKTVFYYDLCFRNLVLKGSKKKLAQILKPYPQDQIGTYDFYCMFQTRMWAVMSLLNKEQDSCDFGDKQFRSYQCSKAIIAICDFLLLARNAYTPIVGDKINKLLLGERCEIELFLSEHLLHATEVKLSPDSKALYYFIEDESMVLNLLCIYRIAFMRLLDSKHLLPSFTLFFAATQMDFFAVAKSVLHKNMHFLLRNANRKKINRMFEQILDCDTTSNVIEDEKRVLQVLLKELSE